MHIWTVFPTHRLNLFRVKPVSTACSLISTCCHLSFVPGSTQHLCLLKTLSQEWCCLLAKKPPFPLTCMHNSIGKNPNEFTSKSTIIFLGSFPVRFLEISSHSFRDRRKHYYSHWPVGPTAIKMNDQLIKRIAIILSTNIVNQYGCNNSTVCVRNGEGCYHLHVLRRVWCPWGL